MPNTLKHPSNQDGFGTLKRAFNDNSGVFGTEGWVSGKIGRKIELEITDETEVYTFSEDAIVLYELTVIYTDASRETLVSVERTA